MATVNDRRLLDQAREERSTPAERRSEGKALRKSTPRSAHADWTPAADRVDPVSTLLGQDESRLQPLVPIRHARMAESAFAFFRGAAAVMAGDLATTPASGLTAQLCGDAHLANFGSFASPERRQVFDLNDFDETLPGPWEWDVKRMATSFVLAAQDNGFRDSDGRDAATKSVASYRQGMAALASARQLDVWYWQLSLEAIQAAAPSKTARKQLDKTARKWRGKNSQRALKKLAEGVDGKLRIKSDPPLLLPLREALSSRTDADDLREQITSSFGEYLDSLQDDRRHLLQRYRVLDMALKVVGVGSVGTRCLIVLLVGRDEDDPLFLQVKEAQESVLGPHLGPSYYPHHGQRVVEGQRLIQSTSDIFLGWSSMTNADYYWRQFHDMKGSADVAAMDPRRLTAYAAACGGTLAHAHARSGDAAAISGYLGKGDSFDRALAEFAISYAAQNERDYAAFTDAISSGRVEVAEESP